MPLNHPATTIPFSVPLDTTPQSSGSAAAGPQQGGLGPVGLPTPRASNAARRWLAVADVTPVAGTAFGRFSWLTMRGLRPLRTWGAK